MASISHPIRHPGVDFSLLRRLAGFALPAEPPGGSPAGRAGRLGAGRTQPAGAGRPERASEDGCASIDLHPCAGEPLIVMADIVKTFKSPAGEFTALKKVSACFYAGQFVSVVGKSGSGKSTLVNMLTGIDHPTSGSVCVGGVPIHKLDESQMSLWRGRNLGIVFQFFQLLPTLSIIENVVLPMDLCNKYLPAEREGRAMDLLRLVGLEDFAHALPAAISGGQQQSVAIARALANDPPIIIADEPTGNLDSRAADEVFEIFKSLAREGKTIVMVTHDSSLASRTERILLLSDGELIDERVARTFHFLPHPRLLWLTKQLKLRRFAPGEALAAPGRAPIGLLLVASGSLEVSLDGRRGAPAPRPALLGPGQFLSDLDLNGKETALLKVAGEAELEVLALEAGEFQGWMGAAPAEREMLLQGSQPYQAWRQEGEQA